jgi:hypothetical protein
MPKPSREEELAREGWVKQITYDEPRLAELAQMYQDLGLEIHLEPFDPDAEPGCAECVRCTPDRYKTIYTRKKPQ